MNLFTDVWSKYIQENSVKFNLVVGTLKIKLSTVVGEALGKRAKLKLQLQNTRSENTDHTYVLIIFKVVTDGSPLAKQTKENENPLIFHHI